MTQFNESKMEKLTICLSIWILLSKPSYQIYVPEQEQNLKPVTYTAGIKTVSYGRPSQIQYHHNYSQVYPHNDYSGSPSSQTEETPRQYPVYNAHTYGSRPQKSERLVYVINGTRVRQYENPTRQVVLYNKTKRAPKIEAYRVCPDEATGQFVYESSCNQFLNCWKGRGYVQNCAPGTLFNPKTLECDFPQKVECITGPRLSILKRERSANSADLVKQIGCPVGFSGLIPNYTDCSKFINCVSGIENFMDCPPGTLFDIDKNICDFPDKAHCFNGENEKLKEAYIDDKLDFEKPRCYRNKCSTNTEESQRLRYRSNEIKCPTDGSGLYKHPTDCSKFLNCAHGQTYIQDCAPGTLFNPIVKICDYPYNVRCESGGQHQDSTPQDPYSGSHSGSSNPTHYVPYLPNSGDSYRGSGQSTSFGYENRTTGIYKHGSTSTSQDPYSGSHSGSSNPTHHVPYLPNSGDSYHGSGQSNSFGYENRTTGIYEHGSTGTTQYQPSQNNYYNQGSQYPAQGSTGHGSYIKGENIPIYSGTGQTSYHRGETVPPINQNQYNQGSRGYGYDQHTYDRGRTQPDGINNGQITGSYDNQNNYNRGSSTNWSRDPYRSRPSSHNVNTNQNAWNRDPYDDINTASHSTTNQNTWNRDPYSGTKTDSSSQGVINQNTRNRDLFGGSASDHQSGTGQNTWNREPYSGNTGPQSGTSQTNWNRDSYEGSISGRQSGNSQSPWNRGPYSASESGTNQNNWNRDPNDRTLSGSTQHQANQNPWDQQYYNRRPGQIYVQGTTLYNQSGTNWGPYEHRPNPKIDFSNEGNNGLNNQRGDNGYTDRQEGTLTQQYDPVTPNYNQVVNVNQVKSQYPERYDRNNVDVERFTPIYRTTKVPFRRPYEPFFGSTAKPRFPSRTNDYEDTIGGVSSKFVVVTTPRIMEKNWPPPFPSTDVNADYVFEYDDSNEVSVEAENEGKQEASCGKSDFRCAPDQCIPKTLVCNGARDCPHGNDEVKCLEYVAKFSLIKNSKLAILEKERWNNVTIATCALLCIENKKFQCRSFNYRRIDRTCLLTDYNEGLTGAIISYYPFDYFELNSEKIDCSEKYVCVNKKCIERSQICDGKDDCGDRMDEKGCKPEDFGYSIRLTGSQEKNEGQIEVSAFGRTGYVCDDKFGMRDANVVCKELGFELGALEVKGNSYYANKTSGAKPFYMMDDVTCIGNETRLIDCDFSGWGVHNCLGSEVAGVVCKTPQEKCQEDYWQCDTGRECLPLAFVCDGLLDCTDGSDETSEHCDAPTQIRLVNGTARNQGRLEIRHHGSWGTICDDDFNEDAAKVVCKQLGYKGSAAVKKDAYFGPGNGPIWLDQVFCSWNESTIEDCSHWNWGEHNCEHSEDVGVICSNIDQYERHSSEPVPQIPQEYPSRCGYRKDSIFDRDDDVHFRVVRGSIAKRGDYPWQAAIRVKGKVKAAHWCGAVVISEKFVLTAAHCLLGYPKGAYVVIAGDYNVDEVEGTEQEAYIEDYYLHEDFRQRHKMNNDIALVKLKGRGFRLNEDVQPICLPENGTDYETGLNCTISGFGSIESGTSVFSHDLRAGWVPLQKREICTMPHVYGDALTEGMICAGSLDEGIDSCDGDSGGPLACLHNGVFTLFGITSWGQHCGYANKPGVYVKVAHYKKWIDDNFNKHSTS